jgi:transcriptional regulator with XRE-family HTH domain
VTATSLTELTVGKRIRMARRAAGLSQEKLANLIGTTRQVIIRWEQDRHLPNAKSRNRLAEATGLTADVFIEPLDEESEEAVLQRQAREMVAPFQVRDGRGAARRMPGARHRKD